MPLSDLVKKAIEKAEEAKAEREAEPEPKENDHAELFDDDTEVEHVYTCD